MVELLTHLGLDTGFTPPSIETFKNKKARAGLEYDIRRENCPYIFKAPAFCELAREIICRDDIIIEHIFIPMRDLYSAAESRRFVEKETLSEMSFLERMKAADTQRALIGGLWGTTSMEPGKQEEVLLRNLYELMLAISDATMPVTVLRFPRIVNDCPYLFEKLKPILRGISYESFSAAFNKTVRPELVHTFSQDDR